MFTVADPVLMESVRKTAVIVTGPVDGGCDGAVYTPLTLIVPAFELPPFTALTCQLTSEVGEFCTEATNFTVPSGNDCAEDGLTSTVTTATGPAGAVNPPQDTSDPHNHNSIGSPSGNRPAAGPQLY